MAFPKQLTRFTAFLALLTVFVLSACTPAAPSPTATTVPPTVTTAPSETLRPSATNTSTATATLVPSATLIPSSTPSPAPTFTATPAAAFDKLQIISVSTSVTGVSVIFKIPGINVAYDVKIRNYPYLCQLDAKAPDRLFCNGLADPPFDKALDLVFSDPQTKQVVYTGSTIYSSALLVKPTVAGWATTNCANRGQNVTCETECRLLANGSPCVVSTCSDACGLYFSVDSCPKDMQNDFASCPPDLFAKMKALYGIP